MTVNIMYASDDAAQRVTVTGWRSRSGRFYGDDEHLARWDGCTHKVCACGAEMERIYTICRSCADKKRLEKYEAMPFKEWDGETPLTLYDDDEFFWNEDDVLDYCERCDISLEDLRLVICEPNYAREIEPDDFYQDDLPEDQSISDVYPDLANAIEKVNELIRKKEKPLSWGGGRFRTSVEKITVTTSEDQ